MEVNFVNMASIQTTIVGGCFTLGSIQLIFAFINEALLVNRPPAHDAAMPSSFIKPPAGEILCLGISNDLPWPVREPSINTSLNGSKRQFVQPPATTYPSPTRFYRRKHFLQHYSACLVARCIVE